MSNIQSVSAGQSSVPERMTPEQVQTLLEKLFPKDAKPGSVPQDLQKDVSSLLSAIEADPHVFEAMVSKLSTDKESMDVAKQLANAAAGMALPKPGAPTTLKSGDIAILMSILNNPSGLDLRQNSATMERLAGFDGYLLAMAAAGMMLDGYGKQQDAAREARIKNLMLSTQRMLQSVSAIKEQQSRIKTAAIAGIVVGVVGLGASLGSAAVGGMKANQATNARQSAAKIEAGKSTGIDLAGVQSSSQKVPAGPGGKALPDTAIPEFHAQDVKLNLLKKADALESTSKSLNSVSSVLGTVTNTASTANSQLSDSDVKGLEAARVLAEGNKQISDEAKQVDTERAQRMQQAYTDMMQKVSEAIRSKNEALKSASRV